MVDHSLLSETLGRSPLGHRAFGTHAPDASNVEILHRLPPLVEGRIHSCFSMTEPETPRSNPTMLAATATRDGDEWVINGQKWFTTSAGGAAFAIVMAVTDPTSAPHGAPACASCRRRRASS
jgi:acyl-CoA dehydrogenase